MPAFQSKKFRSAADMNSIGMRYRTLMNKHPFLMFGLPFMAVIVAGSFVLTPATAVRYERYDRKVRQMTKDEELNVRRSARKVDMKEEYYVRLSLGTGGRMLLEMCDSLTLGNRDLLARTLMIGSRSV